MPAGRVAYCSLPSELSTSSPLPLSVVPTSSPSTPLWLSMATAPSPSNEYRCKIPSVKPMHPASSRVSSSGTPHPQSPGSDLLGSSGHSSMQSAVPSASVSVSGRSQPHCPGAVLSGLSKQQSSSSQSTPLLV